MKLSDVTIRSPRVRDKLWNYVCGIEQYRYFDLDQHIRVFANPEKDFLAFESVEYALQFTSQEHKLNELISSSENVDPVSYPDFRMWLNGIHKQEY